MRRSSMAVSLGMRPGVTLLQAIAKESEADVESRASRSSKVNEGAQQGQALSQVPACRRAEQYQVRTSGL